MKTFQDVIGHEKIKQSLLRSIALGRISHAYLFSGPPGVGKKTTGLAFAGALLCKGDSPDACGICDDCLRVMNGVHPDLKIIKPQGATIKIAQLREVQGNTALTSFGGGRQVYLIQQAESMTVEASNCFLKVLEEPPKDVVFILIADDGRSMLPTVISRCQHYRFKPLAENEVFKLLCAIPGSSRDKARVTARMSMGLPGRALKLLEDADRRGEMLNLVLNLIKQPGGANTLPLIEFSGREEFKEFIDCINLFYRDALVFKVSNTTDLLVNLDYQETISQLAAAYEEQDLVDILLTLEESARMLAGNVNQRLLIDSLALKIAGSKRGG